MRVIAGAKRGLQLKAPKGMQTRPTTDRVKESIFGILTPYLPGATVLDLFSGSGAMAIEALSRGADQAVLVEQDPRACACIRENLAHTGLQENAILLAMPVIRALHLLGRKPQSFTIIFMDPPYERGILLPTIKNLADFGLVRPGGLLVAEHTRKEDIPNVMEKFACVRQQVYGDTVVSFLRFAQEF